MSRHLGNYQANKWSIMNLHPPMRGFIGFYYVKIEGFNTNVSLNV